MDGGVAVAAAGVSGAVDGALDSPGGVAAGVVRTSTVGAGAAAAASPAASSSSLAPHAASVNANTTDVPSCMVLDR
jgi:hypothetical protein